MKQKPTSAADAAPVAAVRTRGPTFPEGLLEHAVAAVFEKLSQRPLTEFARNYWQSDAAALDALRRTGNEPGNRLGSMEMGNAA